MTANPAASRPDAGGRASGLPRAESDRQLAGAAWLLLLATLAVVVFIRIRLATMPLERDEGEYAYMGQLMLDGVPPYQAAFNMKWPGTYASYAVIMAAFGQSAAAIRAGLILVNLATAFFVYQIARRCTNVTGGAIAAAAYAAVSINPAVLGLAAHAAHFVLLPSLMAVSLVQQPGDHRRFGRLLLAGAAAGTATVMKQSGVAFFGFVVFWVALAAWREKAGLRAAAARLAGVGAGFALPVGFMFAAIAAAGTFARFWFWTWDYARAYASLTPLQLGGRNLVENGGQVFAWAPILGVLAAIGAAALLAGRRTPANRAFALSFCAFSFLATCPGLYFARNYLIQLGPAVALLVACGVLAGRALVLAQPRLSAWSGVFVLFAALGAAQALYIKGDIFFRATPAAAARAIYGFNAFPEAEAIGRYLAAHTPPDARIAVIGSEPEIYFYARRRAATGYLYTYPMTEIQPYARRMQREFVAEIEQGRPDYVVYVNARNSWYSLSPDGSEAALTRWFQGYEQKNLTLIGLAEMRDEGSVYRWTFDEPKVRWFGKIALAVYQRMPAPPAAGPGEGAGRQKRTTMAW